jgi:hypothetical protein
MCKVKTDLETISLILFMFRFHEKVFFLPFFPYFHVPLFHMTRNIKCVCLKEGLTWKTTAGNKLYFPHFFNPAFCTSGQINPYAFSNWNGSKRQNKYLFHFYSFISGFILPIILTADYNFCIIDINQKCVFSRGVSCNNWQLAVYGGLMFQYHVLNMEADVFALVTYTPEDSSYRMAIFSEESVPLFGPSLPCPPVFRDSQDFREFLIVKCKLQFYMSIWFYMRDKQL